MNTRMLISKVVLEKRKYYLILGGEICGIRNGFNESNGETHE